MNYPNGHKQKLNRSSFPVKSLQGYGNRGMTLEKDINATNHYYLETDRAVIHKKPTPVQIVNVNYPKRTAAVITEGYFKQPSTTDYNGIYRNNYIDFEAKETKNKTRFPLGNIHSHQIEHMKSVIKHGGICFLLIHFSFHQETYFISAENFFPYWNEQFNDGKKSIAYTDIQAKGHLVPFHFQARIDYLTIIDKLYF